MGHFGSVSGKYGSAGDHEVTMGYRIKLVHTVSSS